MQDEAIARGAHRPHLLFLAAFGPFSAPHLAFHHMFCQHLPRSGLVHSDLNVELPWALLSLEEADCKRPGHVQEQLVGWLDQLLALLEHAPSLGIFVTMGTAAAPVRGAFGSALESAFVLAGEIEPAQVRMSQEVAGLLEHALLRVAPVSQRSCARWVSEERSLYWTRLPTSGGTLRGLAHGDISMLVGLDLRLRLVHARRRSLSGAGRSAVPERVHPTGPCPSVPDTADASERNVRCSGTSGELADQDTLPTARPGDQVEVNASLPLGTRLSLIRQIDLDFKTVPDLPARMSGNTVQEHKIRFVLDNAQGLERVLAIISTGAEGSYRQLFDDVRHASSPDGAVIRLAHLLRDLHDVPAFLLIIGDQYLHTTCIGDLPAMLEPVQAQLASAQLTSALDHLDHLLTTTAAPIDCAQIEMLAGIAFRRRSEPQKSVERLERAVQIAKCEQDFLLVARASRELGRTLIDLGRFDEAAVELSQASGMHEWADDPLEVARDNVYLGLLHFRMDRFEAARDAYLSVLTPTRQANDSMLLAATLEALGQVYHDLGKQREARASFEEALAVFKRQSDTVGVMRTTGDLGLLELDFGHPGRAVTYFLQQLEMVARMDAPPWMGIVKLGLGRSYLALGRSGLARRFLGSALDQLSDSERGNRSMAFVALAETALLDGRLNEAERRLAQVDQQVARSKVEMSWRFALARGKVKQALGDLSGAEQAFTEGLALVDTWRSALSGREKPYALEVAIALHEGWIAYLVDHRAPAEKVLEALESAHARAFTDAQVARERYAPITFEGGPLAASAANEFRSTSPSTVWWHRAFSPESSPALRSDAEYVTFIVTYCLPQSVIVVRVVAAGIEYRVLPLSRDLLNQKVRQACLDCSAAQRTTDVLDPLVELSRELLEPIVDWLKALRPGMPLGIVSHGPLHQLPWSVLPLPSGHRCAGDPLIVTTDLFFTPSLRASVWWTSQLPPQTRGCVVFADADGDLPHALTEGAMVREQLGGALLFAGATATWRQLKASAPHACYLHLAVHAVREEEQASALLLLAPEEFTQDTLLAESDETRAAVLEGTVGIGSITTLALDAALVVLSACEAGAGGLNRAGEGPDLLPWAFLSTGARAVIASAWRADDAAALELMKHFYQHLSCEMPPVSALARAQRALWETQRHEVGKRADWAGFSLIGDWKGGGSDHGNEG